MDYPKISIVTINLNQAQYLEETMRSILDQGYPNLEYIVIDGGSTDGSVEVIKKYERQLAYWVSEKDGGHVFALQKGFEKVTGEIMGWVNSDDKLHDRSLFSIADIFTQLPSVKWITGFPTWYNKNGFPLVEMKPTKSMEKYGFNSPHHYLKWSRWSKVRYYNGDYQAIQQESTFWKRELWENAGGKIDTNYKLAFDMELWCRFFQYEQLYTTTTLLGGFRFSNKHQQSLLNTDEYHQECERALKSVVSNLSLAKKLVLKCRYGLGLLFKLFYLLEIHSAGKLYCRLLNLSGIIQFNIDKNKYEITV